MHQLTIAGKAYRSRLLVGTGKYRDFDETREAVDAFASQSFARAVAAQEAGFADSAHFSRTFRRMFGLPATALAMS